MVSQIMKYVVIIVPGMKIVLVGRDDPFGNSQRGMNLLAFRLYRGVEDPGET